MKITFIIEYTLKNLKKYNLKNQGFHNLPNFIIAQIERIVLPFFNKATPNESKGNLRYLVRIIAILAIHVALSKFVQIVGIPPKSIYYESFILGAWMKQLISLRYGIPLLFCVLFLILYRKRIWMQWSELAYGHSLRIALTAIAAIVAWRYSFYDFNLFYFQGHYFDRFLLIGLLFLIYYRPVFIFPFLIMLRLMISQFETIPGFSWAESSMSIAILTLFLSFFIVYLLCRKFKIKDFTFLLLCLIASHYWLPGLGKMNILWITENQLQFLIPSSHANGWLKYWSQSDINTFMSIVETLNIPLKIMTLLLEFGAMFILFRKRFVPFFMLGWVIMHIGIFFNTGICFWIWSCTSLITFFFLMRKKDNLMEKISFSRLDIVVGMILITGGTFWNRIVKLAWYDTPFTYVYQYEATNTEGETFQLAHHFFAPYDYQFTINSLSYLCDWPLINTNSPGTMKSIMKIQTSDEIFALEEREGVNQYNERKARKLSEFLTQYVLNWNKRQSNRTVLSNLEYPRLLWTDPMQFDERKVGKITSIKVVQVLAFYLNGKCEEFRRKDVLEISIPEDI